MKNYCTFNHLTFHESLDSHLIPGIKIKVRVTKVVR
jgi:hypothetical protein